MIKTSHPSHKNLTNSKYLHYAPFPSWNLYSIYSQHLMNALNHLSLTLSYLLSFFLNLCLSQTAFYHCHLGCTQLMSIHLLKPIYHLKSPQSMFMNGVGMYGPFCQWVSYQKGFLIFSLKNIAYLAFTNNYS